MALSYSSLPRYYGSTSPSPTSRGASPTSRGARSPSYQKRRQQLLEGTPLQREYQAQPPGRASEVIPNKLYFVLVASPPRDTARSHYFQVDTVLTYEPFFLDFGPLHVGHVKRFADMLDAKLRDPQLSAKVIYFYSMFDDRKAATNAACMIALYAVLKLRKSSNDALAMVHNWCHCFMHFKDASPHHYTFDLTVADVVRGVERAVGNGWLYIDSFDADAYEHYEQLVNGDWNWIIPGKFLAFSGPNGPHTTFTPQQYTQLFKTLGVTTVVRLNKKLYPSSIFTQAGFAHHDLFFSDGSNPPQDIIDAFMKLSEGNACVAVHCKAGLGRTGTLIALRMMNDYNFTAREAMGWIRLCRPGSIIGSQQEFLAEIEMRMHQQTPQHNPYQHHQPGQTGSLQQQLQRSQHQLQPERQYSQHQQPLQQPQHLPPTEQQPQYQQPLQRREFQPHYQQQQQQQQQQLHQQQTRPTTPRVVSTREHFVDPSVLQAATQTAAPQDSPWWIQGASTSRPQSGPPTNHYAALR